MKTTLLKSKINNNEFDELLNEVYGDISLLPYQKKRYIQAIKKFEALFGIKDVKVISVPGRSEVGGNHTDHQHGKVLAASINLDIIAIVTKSDRIMLDSDGKILTGIALDKLELSKKDGHNSWSLVRGVLYRLQQLGYQIGGFDGVLLSDVLVGSGMSSSAAFEVLIGNIVSALYNDFKIDPVEIAKAAQYSENVYFKKPSGLMDQMACSVGGLVKIDFRDNDNPVVAKVNTDFSIYNYSLCLVDTKGSHASLTDEYAAIPTEMKKVANFFGKDYVVELSENDIINNISELREKCGDRSVLRALHVLNENKRVDKETNALETKDFDTFLATVKQSGDSSYKYLQNVYVNNDYNNQPMSLALLLSQDILADNGVCRVHGGGFAGTIQAFVKNEFVKDYKEKIEHIFGKDSCHILKVRKFGGMIIVE